MGWDRKYFRAYSDRLAMFAKRAGKYGVIVVAGVGVAVYKASSDPVFASWTTNYTPRESAKWDSNWDR